jgi:SHS family lactate transporter-like MFS transporter
MPDTNAEAGRKRAFLAGFLGWMLDGYDFTILTFVLADIGADFSVDNEALGALGTATLAMRLAGGLAAGWAADRWGRRGPLMLSIAWFSVFAFLSGLSPNYQVLLLFRALFGLGMGGEWAAGMPLVLEHYPPERRGFILGLLQGAFSWGFILAAAAFQYGAPYFERIDVRAWRGLMWTGILPAVLVLWIRARVTESPQWLAGNAVTTSRAVQWRSLLRPDVFRAAGVLAAIMFAYQSMSYWLPTLLRWRELNQLPILIALNVGGIIGAALWGRVAESSWGPRRALATGASLSLVSLPLFLFATGPWMSGAGAFAIGLTGAGIIGIMPTFVGGHFETASRATGWGLVYHLGAAAGALSPYLIGVARDSGWALQWAMAVGVGVATALALALLTVNPGTPVSRKP